MTRLIELSKTTYSQLLKQLYEAGIEAVSEKNWSTLKSTAELMIQPSLAILQVHAHIAKLKKRLPSKDAEFKAAPYQEIIQWARLIQPAYRKWQEKQIECLNDPLWWHGCFEKIKTFPFEQQQKANDVLRGFQEKWRIQSAYAHYSTLDIIHVYQTVMPVFSEWLNYAKIELEQRENSLTPRQKTFYQNYLSWFENALTEEKVLLRTCLRERLAIGLKKGYGAWDQVIGSFQDELKAISILPKTFRSDRVAYGYLTPEAFVTIQQMIEQDGSEKEKEDLHALAYYQTSFDNDAPFAQHRRQYSKNDKHHYGLSRSDTVSFKSTVYRHLPRFLQWLLWDEEVQEQFFQHPHYRFLLAQEAAFLNAELEASSTVLANLLIHPGWQQHQMCLNLLLSERERIEKWLKHPLAFFFPGTVKQLVDYQEAIQQSAHRWMTKQLLLLKQNLAHKENGSLNAEEKSAITSALVNIDVAQKQWVFSPEILAEIVEVKQQYQTLCNLERNKVNLVLPEPKLTTQTLDLRDEFREAIVQAMHIFEATCTETIPYLEPLKEQLKVDAAHYDSVVLRIWLVNYLERETKLPDGLKTELQAILIQSKFSESTLNRSENMALSALKQPSLLSLPQNIPATHIDNPFPVLNENLWAEANPEKFTQHCLALKRLKVPSATDPVSITWNQKLCEYTLALLKEIQALEDWEKFVLYRESINELLQALIDLSSTQFPVLHQSLTRLAEAEKILDKDGWDLFTEFSLAIPIKTLSRFFRLENTDEVIVHNDALSYESQKAFSFLKSQTNNPPVSSAFTDLPANRL